MAPAVLTLALVVPSAAKAQVTQPLVTFIYPQGIQQGRTIDATVSGQNLNDASAIRITGGGVTASVVKVENPSTVRISVAMAADAELGERDLRVITPGGASNRYRFFVGTLPEINEKEPNSEKGQAQLLESLPVLINGQILPADRDLYRFAAKAGQTLVCQAQARALSVYVADAVPGWLESCLTLYDSEGKEIAYVDDFRVNPDPVLVYNVPKDGEYVLEMRDLVFRGRADFVYRLTVGLSPYITHIFPLGWQRNSDAQVELHGFNLPAQHMNFTIPGDNPPLYLVTVNHNGMTSNALPFAVGDTGEARETEPNDTLEQANKVPVPVAINGRIQQKGDDDYFAFAAKKGERLIIEVQARRLDSPLDSFLTLFNSKGQELREQDDTDMGDPRLTHPADSRIDYTFPADDDYVLRIRDIQGNYGQEYAYRLLVEPPRPDYELRIIPDNPRVEPGDTALLTGHVLRKDGFNGEIQLSVQNLPQGFVTSDAVIPAGQSQARFTLTAPPNATVGLSSPSFTGTAVDEKAKAEYDAAEKAAAEAEAAAAGAKAAADKAAAAHANLANDAAAKREQATDAKKKLEEWVEKQQKPAEATLAAAVKAVSEAAAAKTAADKVLAGAKAATTKAQEAHQAAEKAAQDAEAAAKTIAGDAAKSEEEKKKAGDDAAAKRKAADEAKTAWTEAQQREKEAQSGAETAAKKLAEAEAQKKSAEQALAGVKKQVADATKASEAAEKVAKDAETAAAKAKAEADNTRQAQVAAEKVVPEKRRLADQAKSKLDQTVVRQAAPAEEVMQAFSYKHHVPTKEFLLSAIEPFTFALSTDIPPTDVREVPQDSKFPVVVKASRQGLHAALARAEAGKKAADEALAKVKTDLEKAKTDYAQAEKTAKEAETAAATAKAAADKAATASANAQKDATTKRRQATDAKKKVDELVEKQQKPAEAKLAVEVKAVSEATIAKTAADKALTDAKDATTKAQEAHQAAEKAAQEAEAAAKTIAGDAGKSEEEKKKAADDAAAKRKAADQAKTALTQAQQTQQQAQTAADTAAKKLAEAEARKKSAEGTLANVTNQVAVATKAYEAAEKVAKDAETAAATAKAEADKTRQAQVAAEKVAPEKRKLAGEAKARQDQLVKDEQGANAKATEANKTLETAKNSLKGQIRLVGDAPPGGISVPSVVIPADKDEVKLELAVAKPPVGLRQNIIVTGTMRIGNVDVIHFAPAIPIKVVAPPPPEKK